MTKQKLWVLSNLSDFMSKSVLESCLLILFLSPIYRKFSQEKFHPDFSLMSNSGNWSLRPKWFLPQNPSGHKRDKDWQCPASKLHYFYLVSSVYSKALAPLLFPSTHQYHWIEWRIPRSLFIEIGVARGKCWSCHLTNGVIGSAFKVDYREFKFCTWWTA